MDNILAVVPFDESSKKKFESLFFAAYEQQKVAVARYVRSDGAKPKLGILVYMSKGYSYFLKVPFEQDIRRKVTTSLDFLRQEIIQVDFDVESKKRKHPLDHRTTTLKDACNKIDEFIDSLDLTPLGNYAMPKTIFHPTYQRLTTAISKRALYPLEKVPDNQAIGLEMGERVLADSVARCFDLVHDPISETLEEEELQQNIGEQVNGQQDQELFQEPEIKTEDHAIDTSKPPEDVFDIFFD